MSYSSTTHSVAKELMQDPRLANAKHMILETIKEHRKKITSVKPSQDNLKASYHETLKAFETYRGIPLIYPYLGTGIGNGPLVELEDGSVKYDMISGIGTHFSHSHPKLIAASLDAAIENTVMQGNLQQNRDSFELSKALVEASGLNHCILTTSGAMANENGLKLCFAKKAPATRILTFEGTFMGRTTTLAQITDKPHFRQGLPLNFSVDYLPFYNPKDPEGSRERACQALKTYLKRYPKAHAACCFELIQGESGYYPGSQTFFVFLMKILKKAGIPIFIDEVQTFGRTDHLFAFQHFNLSEYPDIVTIGKLSQTCATLYRTAFKPPRGLISQTFTASSSAIRCAKVIIEELITSDYLGKNGKNMQLRNRFVSHLERLSKIHPDKIKGPFGYGLMISFIPYEGTEEQAMDFAKNLFEKGVICFVAGKDPTRIRFHLPTAEMTLKDIDQVVAIIEQVIET
ncbi:MAG: aminotransferase class III-fold pyridoxal phosphate-dependent enzyme [Chlamydiia bacterium]|nr:aminotransferase class III-fold pyridoxal phosphate-dependent enzyme [Chlamydiia bacterium]